MLQAVVQILTMFFGLSLIPIVFIVFFKQNRNFSLLRKYLYYLLLATIAILIIRQGYSVYWAFIISMVGLYEILKHIGKYPKNKLYPLLIYVAFAINFIFVIYKHRYTSGNSDGVLYIYTLVLVFDGMSQLGGQMFGRHQIAPSISPNKTRAGFIIGFLFCVIASLAIEYRVEDTTSNYKYVLIPVLSSGAALAGDLLASMFKRASGIKDFSNLIPSHGGFLDRFDGLIGASILLWLI